MITNHKIEGWSSLDFWVTALRSVTFGSTWNFSEIYVNKKETFVVLIHWDFEAIHYYSIT